MSSSENPPELQLRVRSIKQITAKVKLFELRFELGDPLPSFEAGAHIDVAVGGTAVRSYSLLNDPVERDRYLLAVLREDAGDGGSAWMHDVLREGDTLSCSAPMNTFPLNEAARHHVLIAGGIGITPLLSMTHRLRRIGASFKLHYCTRDPSLTAFRDELATTIPDNIAFYHDGGEPARGLDLAGLLAERPTEADVYICGPRPMIDAAREAARSWPEGSVHFELFSSGKTEAATPSAHADESFVIELARSKVTLVVPPNRSILSVLAENGFSIPSVCKEGWCGTCRTRVLAGGIEHRDDILEEEVKVTNSVMQICVSRALPGEKLVLDL